MSHNLTINLTITLGHVVRRIARLPAVLRGTPRGAVMSTTCLYCRQPISDDGQGAWIDPTGSNTCDTSMVLDTLLLDRFPHVARHAARQAAS